MSKIELRGLNLKKRNYFLCSLTLTGMLLAGNLVPAVNATTVTINNQEVQASGNSLQEQLNQARTNLETAQTKVNAAQSQLNLIIN